MTRQPSQQFLRQAPLQTRNYILTKEKSFLLVRLRHALRGIDYLYCALSILVGLGMVGIGQSNSDIWPSVVLVIDE